MVKTSELVEYIVDLVFLLGRYAKPTNPFTVDLNSEHFQIVGKVIWSGGKVDVC